MEISGKTEIVTSDDNIFIKIEFTLIRVKNSSTWSASVICVHANDMIQLAIDGMETANACERHIAIFQFTPERR